MRLTNYWYYNRSDQGTLAHLSICLNSCVGHKYAPVYNLKSIKTIEVIMITSYQNFIGIDIGKFKNVVAVHKQKSAVEFDNDTSDWQQMFQKFSDTNAIAYLMPCHRVICRWGVERKNCL